MNQHLQLGHDHRSWVGNCPPTFFHLAFLVDEFKEVMVLEPTPATWTGLSELGGQMPTHYLQLVQRISILPMHFKEASYTPVGQTFLI